MGWREVLAFAQRPSFEVALATSRMRFLSRVRHTPAALVGLLQVAGVEWRRALVLDVRDLQSALKPLLDQLTLPTVDSNHGNSLLCSMQPSGNS